jgi:hypothetical protein
MKIDVPEKVLDLLDDIFDLVGIPEDRPKGLGWFTVSFGLPNDGVICAVKFRGSNILSLAKYDGQSSAWQYHTSQWIQVPDMDENIELWHPLPSFEKVEV